MRLAVLDRGGRRLNEAAAGFFDPAVCSVSRADMVSLPFGDRLDGTTAMRQAPYHHHGALPQAIGLGRRQGLGYTRPHFRYLQLLVRVTPAAHASLRGF
jgi:hypothetical protein